MYEWTSTDFARIVPEMAGVDGTTFDYFSELAASQLNARRFAGARRILAGCYLTAHLISVAPPSGIAPQGPAVAAESVGGASVSYAVRAVGASDLQLSRYGVAFLRLARLVGGGGVAL